MTPDEYRDAYEQLGLSQVGAARFLGFDERTSRRWAAGDLEIPRVVAMLLSIMVAHRIKPERALKLANIETEKPIRDPRPWVKK